MAFRDLRQSDIGILGLLMLLINNLSLYFVRPVNHFPCVLKNYHPRQTGCWGKTFTGAHHRLSGKDSPRKLQSEDASPGRGGRKDTRLSCFLGHPAPGAPQRVPGSAASVRKAASRAGHGGLRPLSQALPHLPDAGVHPRFKVTTLSPFPGTTTSKSLCISYRNYPGDPSLGPTFPARTKATVIWSISPTPWD